MLNIRLLNEEHRMSGSNDACHKILYVRSGNGAFLQKNEAHPFFPGLIIVIPPNYNFKINADTPHSIILLEGEFTKLNFLSNVAYIRDNLYSEGRMLVEAMLRTRYNKSDYTMALFNSFIEYISQNIHVSKNFSSIIHEITTQIEKKYSDEDFDLANLLRSVGYTEDYVRDKFLQHTGMTPVKYLTNVRMSNAKHMLKMFGNQMSIQEIAVKCGYFDAGYFSRCFKKLYKISPKQYRELKQSQHM